MNNIDPQVVQSNVQRVETRGGERMDAKPSPVNTKEEVSPEVSDSPVEGKDKNSDVKHAVAQLNDYIQSVQRDLEFRLDEGSGRSVITVVDRNSQEVIRQIPTEVTLLLAQKLDNEEPLLLFSAQV